MKRKELEEFKKRWEENLGGLGEMLNSPWFAVSIKYEYLRLLQNFHCKTEH